MSNKSISSYQNQSENQSVMAVNDPEKLFDIETTPRKITPPQRSQTSIALFDLALEVVPSKKTQKTEYENQLHQEAIDWSHLLKNKKLVDLARARSSKVCIDKSVLSQEQLAYIERSKHVEEFVKGSRSFLLQARRYLDEYQLFVEMQEKLVELTNHQVDAAAFDLIYNCKYKRRNCDWIS